MPTTGVINGTLMRVTLDGDEVIRPTNCTMSLSMETRETLSKDDTGAWASSAAGTKSGTISFEGLYSQDDTIDADARVDSGAVFALFDTGAAVAWELTTGVTGDEKYSGSGLLTSFEAGFPVEENATYSGTITITGAITKATIA